jgi:hypothetical protein
VVGVPVEWKTPQYLKSSLAVGSDGAEVTVHRLYRVFPGNINPDIHSVESASGLTLLS